MKTNPMTGSQEKFIKYLLGSVTISGNLKDKILARLDRSTISLPDWSRLIKALLELDFNYLTNFAEVNNESE